MFVECDSIALTVHARANAGGDWIATALTGDETLTLPVIGAEVPVADSFAGTDLANPPARESAPG